MNTVPSIDRSVAVAANPRTMRAHYSLVFDASKIRIIREGIGNSGRRRKCENC
jgi:hypothetical protein